MDLFFHFLVLGLASLCAGQSTPSSVPFPTTVSQTRFTIDFFNLTYSRASDAVTASVGAVNKYGDSIGSLVATAVLVKSPTNVVWNYRPTRVDVLFHALSAQPSRPSGISDFLLTLYSDDGSSEHNPAFQVRKPTFRFHSTQLFAYLSFRLAACVACIVNFLDGPPPNYQRNLVLAGGFNVA
jgi:hypothetical protein